MPNFTKKTSYSILSGQSSKKIDAFFKEIQKEADIIENSINERERQLNSIKKDESKYRELLNELTELKNELIDAERAVKIVVAKNAKSNIKNLNSNDQPNETFLNEVFAAQNKVVLKDAEYKRKQEEIKNLRDAGDLYPDEVYKKEKEHIEFVKKTYKNVVTIFHKLQLLHDKPEKTRKQLSLKFKPDLDKLIAIVKQAAQTKILNNIETSAFNDIIAKATKLTKTYAVISSVLKSSTKKFGKGLVSKFSNAYVESAKKSSMFGRVVFSFMGVDKEKISDLQIESENLLDDDYDVPTGRATKVPRPTVIEENTPNNKLMRREAVEGEEVPTATPENIARKALDTETLDAELIKEPVQPEFPPSEGQKLLPESSSNIATRQGPVSPQNSPTQPTLIDNNDNSSASSYAPPISVGRSSTVRPAFSQGGGRTSSRVYNNGSEKEFNTSQVVQLLTSIDTTLKSILSIFKRAEDNAKKRYEKAEADAETAEELRPDVSTTATSIVPTNQQNLLLPEATSSGGGMLSSLMNMFTGGAAGSGVMAMLRKAATSIWTKIPWIVDMAGTSIAALGGFSLAELILAAAVGYAAYKLTGMIIDKLPENWKPQKYVGDALSWVMKKTNIGGFGEAKETENYLQKNIITGKLQNEEADKLRKELGNIGLYDKNIQDSVIGQAIRESNLNPRAEENLNYKTVAQIVKMHGASLAEQGIDPSTLVNNPEGLAEASYGYKSSKGRGMGSTKPGEGWKYRGRGDIMLTGKNNYIRMGKALGIDLENNPDLAATPEWSAKIAAQFYNTPKFQKMQKQGASLGSEEIYRQITSATLGSQVNLDSALGQELLAKGRDSVVNKSTLTPTVSHDSNVSLNQTSSEQTGRKVLTDTLANQSKEPAIVSSHVTMQNNNVTNVNNGGGGSANGRGFIKSPLDESSIRLVLGH